MANEMLWTTQSGYLTNNQLNMKFQRAAQPMMKFQQFVMFKSAFGKHAGQTENWLKVSNLGSYGRKLIETNTMPESTQPLTWGTVTVNEYGLSVPHSFKIEALSEFNILSILKESLLDDYAKVQDGVVERGFNATKLRYVGTATDSGVLTTDGTATIVNTSVLNAYHVRKIVSQLKKRFVPGWAALGGDYVCIASIDAIENMSSALETVNQYTESGYKKILNGEVGRYHGVRFIEDQWATEQVYDEDAGSFTATTWAQAQSLPAYFFGQPSVRQIVAVPTEIRIKVPTDFGRSKGVAWYGIQGNAIEWDTAANTRIIKWDSAS